MRQQKFLKGKATHWWKQKKQYRTKNNKVKQTRKTSNKGGKGITDDTAQNNKIGEEFKIKQ